MSGSGKSSLAFDTIYSEGQRRYVETFSPYARQFLERMDKPHLDSLEGIPPAIAIDLRDDDRRRERPYTRGARDEEDTGPVERRRDDREGKNDREKGDDLTRNERDKARAGYKDKRQAPAPRGNDRREQGGNGKNLNDKLRDLR